MDLNAHMLTAPILYMYIPPSASGLTLVRNSWTLFNGSQACLDEAEVTRYPTKGTRTMGDDQK